MIHNDPEHLSKAVKQIFDNDSTLATDFYTVAAQLKATDNREGLNDYIRQYLDDYLNSSDDKLLCRVAERSFSYSFIHKLASLYWNAV